MAIGGDDPIGSMGTDTPISVLSSRPKLLYSYFKQNFAQVTNPPIDPIREELVMSLVSMIGPRPNLLDLDSGGSHLRLEVKHPILTNEDLEKIRHVTDLVSGAFRTCTLDITWSADAGRRRHGGGARCLVRRRAQVRARRLQHPDPVRPCGRPRPHRHSGAAGDGRGAPSPHPRGRAHRDRPGGGDRRGARGASFLPSRGLWRRSDQSVPGLRDAEGDAARSAARRG